MVTWKPPSGSLQRTNKRTNEIHYPLNPKVKMRTKVIMTICLFLLMVGKASAQWSVIDPTNIAQSIINSSNNIVHTSSTAQNMINNFKETVKIYEQGKKYYDALKSVNNLVKDAPGDRTAAKIEKLLAWLESLKAELGIPKSIREAGVQEADFLAHVDKLSEDAFDDQCTGANPRYPLIAELKQILLDTFYGNEFSEGETAAKKETAAAPKADKKAKKSA